MIYPRITIITPTFNQGLYIEETINSVLSQNYPNLEYIIIDGDSSDGTRKILKKYSKYINYWESKKDNGQGDAINKGLKKATGEIINWLNSDDLLTENTLFDIANNFSIHNPDILCGFCDYFSLDTSFTPFRHRTTLYHDAELTLLRGEINQPSMFYKASIFKDLGGVNADLFCVMDLDLFYRYLIKYGQEKILLSDNLYSKFRIHELSKTSSGESRFIEERKILMNTVVSLSNIPEKLKSVITENSQTFNNYTPSNKLFNLNKYLLYIFQDKYFEIYNKGEYEATLTLYFRLLFAGKHIFSKIHHAVAYKSLLQSLK